MRQPKLCDPVPGSGSSHSMSEITVAIPKTHQWHKGLSIRAYGVDMIKEMEVQPFVEVVRAWEQGDWVYIRIKSKKPWPCGHVLVQIQNEDSGQSVNQYFLIKDSIISCSQDDAVRVPGGFFYQDRGFWVMAGLKIEVPSHLQKGQIVGPGCVYYKKLGMLAWLDEKMVFRSDLIPPKYLSWATKISMQPDGDDYSLIAMLADRSVVLATRDTLHHYAKSRVKDVGMTKGLLHVNEGSRSLHLPCRDKPFATQKDLSQWWPFELSREEEIASKANKTLWSMVWSKDSFVWHTKHKMICMIKPDVFMGSHEDSIFWTKEDVEEDFNHVELVGGEYAVINGTKLINMNQPSIESLL